MNGLESTTLLQMITNFVISSNEKIWMKKHLCVIIACNKSVSIVYIDIPKHLLKAANPKLKFNTFIVVCFLYVSNRLINNAMEASLAENSKCTINPSHYNVDVFLEEFFCFIYFGNLFVSLLHYLLDSRKPFMNRTQYMNALQE